MALPASDNFDRSNESPLATNWSTAAGASALVLSSNKVTGTSGGWSAAYWDADTFANDQYSQVKFLDTNLYPHVAVRIKAEGTSKSYYLFGTLDATTCRFGKWVNDSFTQLGSNVSHTIAANTVVKMAVTGTGATFKLEVWIDGVSEHTYEASESSITAGSAGISIYNNSAYVDDWAGGDVTAAGRTTKNTRPHPLGIFHGMGFRQ